MPDQTKERIIEAAYRALVKRGYHETSMKDIAAEAGLAPGLAHYYFETKEDLLVATIEHACAPAMRAWEEAGMSLSGPLPENVEDDLDRGDVRVPDRRYRLLDLLDADAVAADEALVDEPLAVLEDGGLVVDRPGRAFIARITQGVIAGMPEPPTASADAIAAALWGSLHGIYLQKVMDPGFDADAAIDALSEMAIAFATATPTRFRQEG